MPDLPALYLPWSSSGRHAFADRLEAFADAAPAGSALILHAPTGAGKTRAVIDIASRHKTLLCMPTNALAAEVEETARAGGRRVATWNAKALGTKGLARHHEMIQAAFAEELIVANPDLLHLFAQHEDVPDGFTVTSAHFGLKNLDLLVFDEYHAYDERLLASILLHVLRSSRNRDHRQRFVFMSATPDEALPAALASLGIEADRPPAETATPVELPPERGRMIKGTLRVDVSGASILESLPRSPPEGRTLFIFSTFLQQQAAVRILQQRGFKEANETGGVVQITGRKTSSSLGQDRWDKASILLGTSKVEVGLNIDQLDEVVMEPGWSEQQFWQRFGRAGRGRPGRVRLHLEGYPEERLAPLRAAAGYDELAAAVGALLRPETRHVTTILRFVGAYAAAHRANVRSREAVPPDNLPGAARSAYHLIDSILRGAPKDPLRDAVGGSLAWRNVVANALRGLRGRALRVKAIYAWSPEDVLDEDLTYLCARTDATRPPAGEPWRVTEILPYPRDAQVHYRILHGEDVRIPTRGRLGRKDFQRLPRAIEESVREELDGDLPSFWEALTAWLRMVPPDEIPPLGVEIDDLFL